MTDESDFTSHQMHGFQARIRNACFMQNFVMAHVPNQRIFPDETPLTIRYLRGKRAETATSTLVVNSRAAAAKFAADKVSPFARAHSTRWNGHKSSSDRCDLSRACRPLLRAKAPLRLLSELVKNGKG